MKKEHTQLLLIGELRYLFSINERNKQEGSEDQRYGDVKA